MRAHRKHKKGIYGEMYPDDLYGDYYLTKRGLIPFKERLAIRLLNNRFSWWLVTWLMEQHPEFFIHRLEQAVKPYSIMDIDKNLENIQKLENFQDLLPLYRPFGITRQSLQLDFDEARYLFDLVRSLKNCKCLEIGRYRGGSTLLFAVAMDNNSKLTSVDNLTKFGCDDEALKNVLARFSLSHKVELIMHDSGTFPVDPASFDLIFIDGDHSYKGIKRDYDHLKQALKPGGHLLFHDAAYGRRFVTVLDGPGKCVDEIQKNDSQWFKKVTEVGSLIHFLRTRASW